MINYLCLSVSTFDILRNCFKTSIISTQLYNDQMNGHSVEFNGRFKIWNT